MIHAHILFLLLVLHQYHLLEEIIEGSQPYIALSCVILMAIWCAVLYLNAVNAIEQFKACLDLMPNMTSYPFDII